MRFLKTPSPRHQRRLTAMEESQEEEIRQQGEDAAKKLHDLIPMDEAQDGTPVDIFEDREDYIRALGLAMIKVERFPEAVNLVGQLLEVDDKRADLRPGFSEYARALAQKLGGIADLGRHDPKRVELELMHLFRPCGPLRWAKKCLKRSFLLAPPPIDKALIVGSPIDGAYFSFRFAQERLEELAEPLKDRSKKDALDTIRTRSQWLAERIEVHPRKFKLLDFLTGEDEPNDLEKAGRIACWVAAELGAEEAGVTGQWEDRVLNFLTNYALRKNPARRGGKQKRKETDSCEPESMEASA